MVVRSWLGARVVVGGKVVVVVGACVVGGVVGGLVGGCVVAGGIVVAALAISWAIIKYTSACKTVKCMTFLMFFLNDSILAAMSKQKPVRTASVSELY